MKFPVGFEKFHKNPFFNYQLNRWYSLGYTRKEDMVDLSSKIHNFDDYIALFTETSKVALRENRLKNAAMYLRAAEFLIPPDAPDKITVYQDFIRLFDKAFENDFFQRHQIPYNHSFLSAIKIPSKSGIPKGTIIGCGGFDSFIEEFYGIWKYFAENGYDVIAFEGPGQGGSRRLFEQAFDHDWEKPVSSILDYFQLNDVSAIGLSMGGYWIMRAAAFEKRIRRVIAMPPVYDWLEMTHSFNKYLLRWMLPHKKLVNFLVRLKMKVGVLKHTINNAIFIQNKKEPIDAVHWFLGMNKTHLNSHLTDQDVLLLTGENDAFQLPVLMKKQKEALVNAKSVETRIFKKSEHADQHCQMGNIGLACETILDWLNKKI